jgi:hypothetical protein
MPKYTKNEMVEQVRTTCRASPEFFATRFVKTEDPQADVPERQWPAWGYLNEVLETFHREAVTLVAKSRQLMISWAVCVYSIVAAGFDPSRQVLIQSQKEQKAQALILRIDYVLRHLPRWLLPGSPEVKKNEICFHYPSGDKSYIWAVPHGPDQVASYSPSVCLFDEAGLQDKLEGAWRSAAPAIRGRMKAIVVGTPRGHNFWHQLYTQIKPGVQATVHYTQHPEYQAQAEEMGGWEKWREAMMAKWGYRLKSGQFDHKAWQRELEINWDVTPGKTAFPSFSRSVHVQRIGVNPALPVIRGWDFGFHHPSCVLFQIHPSSGQVLILRSILGHDVQLQTFVQQAMRMCREAYPGALPYSLPGGAYEDYCDPAGAQAKDSGNTCIQVLNENRIYPSYRKSRPLDRVRMIERCLSVVRDGEGIRPGLLIDPSCETLIQAFDGGAAFESDEDESPDFGLYQHELDALGYALDHKLSLGAVCQGKRHHA